MKSITLKSSLLFLLMIVTILLSAQDNLLEGYILTHEGETVHGYIETPNFRTNPSKIIFRVQAGDLGIEYDPYDIQAFSIDGQVFEGGFIDVELSPVDLNTLSENPDLVLSKELAFLQAIIRGDKSLYVHRNYGTELFYIKKDSIFELLQYKRYISNKIINGQKKRIVQENRNYLGQLNIYLIGCPEQSSKIELTKYNQRELAKLFLSYYYCTKEEFRSYLPERKPIYIPIKLGLSTGLSLTSMDYNYIKGVKEMQAITQAPFSIGLNLTFDIKPKLSAVSEFALTVPYSYNPPSEYYHESSYDMELIHNYRALSRKLSLIGRYTTIIKNFTVFGNVGLSHDKISGSYIREEIKTFVISSDKTHYVHSGSFTSTRIVAGAGIKISRVSFEARVEPAIPDSFLGTTASFILGFSFWN